MEKRMKVLLICLTRRGGLLHFNDCLAESLSRICDVRLICGENADHRVEDLPDVDLHTIDTGKGAKGTVLKLFSPAVTDAEGNTTTNTVEVSSGTDGVQVKNETTTETPNEKAESSAPEDWYDTFSGGAEGTDADGEDIYFAYDDPNDIKYAMLVTVSPDKTECHVRNGEVIWNEETESSAIYDKEVDALIPFEISESDEEDTFIMTFLVDNDVVTMRIVEQDVIINDIQSVMSNYTFE